MDISFKKEKYIKYLDICLQEAATQSWNAMIDEDRLLQRLETLEAQLTTYSKVCNNAMVFIAQLHDSLNGVSSPREVF